MIGYFYPVNNLTSYSMRYSLQLFLLLAIVTASCSGDSSKNLVDLRTGTLLVSIDGKGSFSSFKEIGTGIDHLPDDIQAPVLSIRSRLRRMQARAAISPCTSPTATILSGFFFMFHGIPSGFRVVMRCPLAFRVSPFTSASRMRCGTAPRFSFT